MGVDRYESETLKYMLAVGSPQGAAIRSHIADALIDVGKDLKQPPSQLCNFKYLNNPIVFSFAVLFSTLRIYSDGARLGILS